MIARLAMVRAETLISCEKKIAITTIAPRSSIIAKASKNIFNAGGTCLLNSATIPTANAMSVAIGIAQPSLNSGC